MFYNRNIMDGKKYKTKKIAGKAVLKNIYSATFYESFHNNAINDDHIYKLIKNISEKHMIENNINVTDFKFPYNDNIFRFKNGDKIICLDKNNKPCMIEDCFDKNIVIYLSVTPYDFISDDNRIVGVSLKVNKIKLCC